MTSVFGVIVSLNLLLILILLFIAYRKKEKLRSEKAREIVTSNWRLFEAVLLFSLLGLLVFLAHETREFAAVVFGAKLPNMEEGIEGGIMLFVFFATIVNLYIVFKILKKNREAAE